MTDFRTRLTRRAQNTLRPVHYRIASTLPPRVRRQYMYTVRMGRPGNFTEPRTFNEKVNWRILHDRRPLIAAMCDKDRMKDIARERVPELRAPKTLWRGTDLSTTPDLDRVGPWVLKPNHSSGEVIFGPGRHGPLTRRTEGWLASTPYTMLGEWGYGQARAAYLLEERLPTEAPPSDYKFYVFDGVPRLIQVNAGRGSGQETATFYTPDWVKLPARWVSIPDGDNPRPATLPTMLDHAARLGAGLDFIRVDLYEVNGEPWFGELSPYPGGGMMRFRPRSFATTLGDWWTLPPREAVAA